MSLLSSNRADAAAQWAAAVSASSSTASFSSLQSLLGPSAASLGTKPDGFLHHRRVISEQNEEPLQEREMLLRQELVMQQRLWEEEDRARMLRSHHCMDLGQRERDAASISPQLGSMSAGENDEAHRNKVVNRVMALREWQTQRQKEQLTTRRFGLHATDSGLTNQPQRFQCPSSNEERIQDSHVMRIRGLQHQQQQQALNLASVAQAPSSEWRRQHLYDTSAAAPAAATDPTFRAALEEQLLREEMNAAAAKGPSPPQATALYAHYSPGSHAQQREQLEQQHQRRMLQLRMLQLREQEPPQRRHCEQAPELESLRDVLSSSSATTQQLQLELLRRRLLINDAQQRAATAPSAYFGAQQQMNCKASTPTGELQHEELAFTRRVSDTREHHHGNTQLAKVNSTRRTVVSPAIQPLHSFVPAPSRTVSIETNPAPSLEGGGGSNVITKFLSVVLQRVPEIYSAVSDLVPPIDDPAILKREFPNVVDATMIELRSIHERAAQEQQTAKGRDLRERIENCIAVITPYKMDMSHAYRRSSSLRAASVKVTRKAKEKEGHTKRSTSDSKPTLVRTKYQPLRPNLAVSSTESLQEVPRPRSHSLHIYDTDAPAAVAEMKPFECKTSGMKRKYTKKPSNKIESSGEMNPAPDADKNYFDLIQSAASASHMSALSAPSHISTSVTSSTRPLVSVLSRPMKKRRIIED